MEFIFTDCKVVVLQKLKRQIIDNIYQEVKKSQSKIEGLKKILALQAFFAE